jgi:hypothetical protein
MGAVKGGIEAGDLWQVGLRRGDRADAGEVVRLVQGRERAEPFEPVEHRIVDPHAGGELRATVHHAVADAGEIGIAKMLAQPVDQRSEEGGVIHASVLPAAVGQLLSAGVLRDHVRLGADALDLAREHRRRLSVVPDPIERELEARGARVDGQDRVRHGKSSLCAVMLAPAARAVTTLA